MIYNRQEECMRVTLQMHFTHTRMYFAQRAHTLHCLCVRITDRNNECRSRKYACSPHNHKCTHTHSIVLLVLEAHRKCCIITSCSTLSSQSHNTYFHFVHKFIHDLAPTLVFLQCEVVRCDITTAHLGNNPQRPASSHLPSSLSPPQLHWQGTGNHT